MYNLYIYEKQLIQNEKKKKELIKANNWKRKRKKVIDKLTQNYNDRMNEFIFSMCENPILLNREENPNNINGKIKSNKKYFSFTSFKTDKERIKLLEEEKNKQKIYDEKRIKDEKNRNILTIKNHRDLVLIQPKMRFNSRTKLENIIEIIKKREESANIDIYNNSLMEQIKRLKYNDVKKIKEFYNLIDKDKLNDEDLKKIIKKLNENEQNIKNDEFTLKNYIQWKYHGKISYNNLNKNNKSKSQKNLNSNTVNEILEIVDNNNKNNNNKRKNEFECLVKNDFKTHFKGASQFISMKDLDDFKTNIVNRFSKNNYNFQKIKKNNYINKRAASALKLTNKSIKNISFENQKDSQRNDNINKMERTKKIRKRPASVALNKYQDNGYHLLMNKNGYDLKDLDNIKNKKKIIKDDLINNDLNNSIVKHYINKYDLINEFNKSGIINQENFALQNNYNIGDKKDEELKEKLNYLKKEIDDEQRLINNDKYKKFLKRFARSSFGFRKKEIIDSLEEIKEDKKSEYIVIDGKIYPKKNMKDIAEIAFHKCNYYKRKSIFNDSSLVKNNGKMSFTSGLTLNDFSSKYNL